MAILLGYTSALNYWRSCSSTTDAVLHAALLGSFLERKSATAIAKRNLGKQKSKAEILEYWFANPEAHFITLGQQVSPNNRKVKCHTYKSLPNQSCVQANLHFRNAKILVSSPEFCFLQMANLLPLEQLISLGFELCSTYSKVDSDTRYNVVPLTSKNKLSAFIDKAGGRNGVKKARRALRYILPESASPMESNLAMLLCLPYSLGGYGFPSPQLNYQIDLPPSFRKQFGHSHYTCDLFWPDFKLGIEYDSDEFHVGINKTVRDAMRRSVLTSLDLSILSVTKRQVYNTRTLNQLANIVSESLNKRLRYTNPTFIDRHIKLRELILYS